MPRTNVVGTTAPPGSGAQRCAQAGKREHITDSTARTATATAADWNSVMRLRLRPRAGRAMSPVRHTVRTNPAAGGVRHLWGRAVPKTELL